MKVLKILSSLFLTIASLFILATPTFAGGGLIKLNANPPFSLHPGEWFMVTANAYLDGSYTTKCVQCPIVFKFIDPKSSDVISQGSTATDQNGEASAKMSSYVLGNRIVSVDVQYPNGETNTSSQYILGYNQSYIQIDMVYPQDGQTIDLEGAYMFKINPVTGASGYLFGFFQDGQMIYENYRNSGTLSSNGEFALWESNPFHSKFHEGQVSVVIRALVDGKWTDSKNISVYLKSRLPSGSPMPVRSPATYPTTGAVTTGGSTNSLPTTTSKPTNRIITPPVVGPNVQVVIDSSASAELQKRVDELQNKLEESQQKQTVLENRLNVLINWIKSIFPFFK